MAATSRGTLPSRSILTATLLAAAAPVLLAALTGSAATGFACAVVAAMAAAVFIERRLSPLIGVIELIASGDRYAALPAARDGLSARLADAAETMRKALIAADALAVAQRSREAELKIRNAGRAFFTQRFRSSVDEVVSTFNAAGEDIRVTAGDLAARNGDMREQVSTATAAAAAAARDVDGLAQAARAVIDLIARSSHHVSAVRDATDRTAGDLARADQIVRGLAEAAGHIGDVSKLIQAIAAQTSMLALNATIEAARAGETGRGFAVVASEVKMLANQTSKAASDIEAQINAIRRAVEETVGAIGAVSESVGAMAGVNRNLTETLKQEAAELDRIGCRAASVAREVGDTLPDVSGVVAQVECAGQSVLTTAEDLLGRSQFLVGAVGRFFEDLDDGAIRVGILHSLSGTMTGSERPLQELLVMMIEQCNARGGLLGRPIEAVIMDPHSNSRLYADQARALLCERKVDVIFGCWTSASRKETLPVLERENGLLFYPSQYEGEERSPNIVYTGGTPSQTAIPAVDFLRGKGARRFFLVGGDDVYPRITNAILKAYLAAHGVSGGDIVERYAPADLEDWREIGEDIRRFGARPGSAVVTTVSGDANLHFFREFARSGCGPDKTPIMSLSIGEAELPALTHCHVDGLYVAWTYLHAIDTEENRRFVADWRRFKRASEAMTNDAMEATFIGFDLWTAAVVAAGSAEVDKVRAALAGRDIRAPSGFTVRMDRETQHLHKPAFVGRVEQGRILPVRVSDGLIAPEPWSPWLAKAARARAA